MFQNVRQSQASAEHNLGVLLVRILSIIVLHCFLSAMQLKVYERHVILFLIFLMSPILKM